MESNRNQNFDVLKGVGILAVLLGHLPISMVFINFIYLFHMPLFFFVAGALLKFDSIGIILKKNKGLFFSFFFYLLLGLVIEIRDKGYLYVLKSLIINELLLFRSGGISKINSLLIFWFPFALFSLKIIDSFFKTISVNIKFATSILLFLIINVFSLGIYFKDLPFCLGQGLILAPYFYLGSIIKEDYKLRSRVIISLIIGLIVFFVFYLNNYDGFLHKITNFHQLDFGNFILSFILTMCALVVVLNIGIKIGENRFLQLLGKYSYFIMASHLLFFIFLRRIVSNQEIVQNAFFSIALLALTIFFQWLIIRLFENKFRNVSIISNLVFLVK